jgi:hypothetical protein
VGQVVAHFIADPKAFEDTGKVLLTAQLAERYGVVDEDGSKFLQGICNLNTFSRAQKSVL